MRVLVIDIGGSHVKVFAPNGKRSAEIPSGHRMTPQRLLSAVREVSADWKFQGISIGYPGKVKGNSPQENAPNLGKGWIGFNFARAFRRPVKILNDAALQALGSYKGGRMLFLGLGTGLGSALILEGVVHAMELGDLPYRDGSIYSDYLGKGGLKRWGRSAWCRHVKLAVKQFRAALEVDYVVLGGGQAKLIRRLPARVLRGSNSRAFAGGVRAWQGSRRSSSQRIILS